VSRPATNGVVDAAQRDVEKAERMLSHRLEEAGLAGHATVDRAFSLVRPLVIGAVAAAGLVWFVSALRRPRRRGFVLPEPSRPSVVGEALRTASLSLATAAARRLAEHWFAPHTAAPSPTVGRPVSTHDAIQPARP
jgi:hypothetical protein